MTAPGGTLRIIAGDHRGRRIAVPPAGTRPMTDRVRESLFGVLEPRIVGARFADLCAGSGAVGIEALSRGAVHALFVERSRDAVAIIQANLARLKLTERATLQGADVLLALDAPGAPFDLIVADPPYDDAALAEGILARCAAPGGPLADEGLLALTGRTRPGNLPLALPEGLRCVRTLIYGDSCVDLLERTEAT
ncbi:MAG: 16S rRNA (guanine(966)-N(2))-methyltransferase RsmD [Chloroflexi bacterium]|jgi:16S rRNA (guanine966-N2)-methyltransferase|nr:16S rRNA (guanine(966)-N(2))-methyltransferase RsmD [Chloroflexota bacterium]MBJ7360272.1 16S rRNA (guanine(966)-N(2))-methyltransferase RsmD [Chloroflexota bacterium]MBJ7482571.1 16S rRNA (guanine(966)-N(2))-methyltransferase RsmD [Chloroflexota bacterium]